MSEIKIGENGNWYIDGVDTGKPSRGKDGLSAYEVAVSLGYQGTLADWPDTLKGEPGQSAYEIARDLGYQGTMADWINSLKGAEGLTPQVGENGNWFVGDEDTRTLADAEKAVEKKIVASTDIKEAGMLMDGKTVSEALAEVNGRFIKKKFTNTFCGTGTTGKKNNCPLPKGYEFHSLSFNQDNPLIVPYGRYKNDIVVTNFIFVPGVTSADTTVETTVIFEKI